MNRSLPPPARPIDRIRITQASTTHLTSGITLHLIEAGEHDILQLEIILHSGKWYEPANGISFFASKMLSEGTSRRTSREISEFFESLGAQFILNPGLDLVALTVICLEKHLNTIIPLVAECLFNSSFPGSELSILKDLQIQQIKVNHEKGSYVAAKEFRKMLFGTSHPYGQSLEIEDIGGSINPESLKHYHSGQLLKDMELILTGKIKEEHIHLLDTVFHLEPPVFAPAERRENAGMIRPGLKKIPKPGSLQASLRYGKRIIQKTHPDYPGLMVLNELLGGFFGSRLMKNIREEKGYTYGIYSSIHNFLYDSYFVISADLIREHTLQAIEEINKELIRLQTEPAGEEEMEIVRNYMLGSFLSSLETSFSLTEKFKSIYFHGLGYDYYDRYLETVKTITPRQIQDLAAKYLSASEMSLVTVGEE